MIPARSTAAAGLLFLLLITPAAAQTTGPADGGVHRNDPSARSAPLPPVAKETQPSREPRAEPPANADDGFELPPPAGCQYRDNKLDLIV
jgi:hypothetical protein